MQVSIDEVRKESGDIDVLLKSEDKSTFKKFINELTKIEYLYPEHLAIGQKKYNGLGKIKNHLIYRRIDIMYTTPAEYPFAILCISLDQWNLTQR